MSSQTEWKYPKNANTQYQYREFNEQQQEEEFKKDELNTFMSGVRPRFEEALQQNEIMNVFYDDWTSLSSGTRARLRYVLNNTLLIICYSYFYFLRKYIRGVICSQKYFS